VTPSTPDTANRARQRPTVSESTAKRRAISSFATPSPAASSAVAPRGSGPLRVAESRTAGTVWLLDGLWSQLEIGRALAQVLGPRRFTTDVERVLLALVANRAVDPMSKLSAAECASHDAAVPGLEVMDDDQAYRARARRTDPWTPCHFGRIKTNAPGSDLHSSQA